MRTFKVVTLAFVAALSLTGNSAQAIENVRGKQYNLTTRHGPWMIMVTSFRNVRESQFKDGLSAEQAAAELVFELRELGVPAYTYSQDAIKGEIETRDRLGRGDHRIFAAQRDMICVLAGNYESIEDKVGQKTLNYIKKFHPKFLKDVKSGAILRADANQRGPLVGAFLTINPLLKPEEVVQKHVDKEIKMLNSGIAFPLVKNPHKYTVRVATFSGKSVTPLGNSSYRGLEQRFDREIGRPNGYNIVWAGEDAEHLTAFLRRTKAAQKAQGIDDAYTYHDKFQSIVTVGSFDSPDDPRIQLIKQYYGPKLVPDMQLLQKLQLPGQPFKMVTPEDAAKLPQVLTTHTEQLFPPDANKDALPSQVWTFDTEPTVIAIPRIK